MYFKQKVRDFRRLEYKKAKGVLYVGGMEIFAGILPLDGRKSCEKTILNGRIVRGAFKGVYIGFVEFQRGRSFILKTSK